MLKKKQQTASLTHQCVKANSFNFVFCLSGSLSDGLDHTYSFAPLSLETFASGSGWPLFHAHVKGPAFSRGWFSAWQFSRFMSERLDQDEEQSLLLMNG